MDKSHIRPRLSAYQRNFAAPAAVNTHASVVADMPLVSPPRPFGSVQPKSAPDFKVGAKTYKRSQIKRRALKGVAVFGIGILLLLLLLGVIGYVLNERYAGKALPYTYVGDISIGGLTQPEIKAALDKRAEEIRVTLTEGGLVRDVPVKQFGAQFDTQKASEDAITGFNPFSYLTKRTVTVPVQVNERYVDGYLRLHVANMQTDAENAEIVKAKKDLVIVPETTGFRTSSAYVTEQLQKQLPTLDDPTVSLSAVTDKPSITQADLQDDIDTARKLIATNIGIKAYNTVIRPTDDQKLSWLEIKQIPGSNEVQIQFSQTKVREYVFEATKKYSTEPVAEQIVTNADGTQSVQAGKSGYIVANIDEVAANVYRALMNQQPQVVALVINPVEYQKIDPSLVPRQQAITAVPPQSAQQTQANQAQTLATTQATQ